MSLKKLMVCAKKVFDDLKGLADDVSEEIDRALMSVYEGEPPIVFNREQSYEQTQRPGNDGHSFLNKRHSKLKIE